MRGQPGCRAGGEPGRPVLRLLLWPLLGLPLLPGPATASGSTKLILRAVILLSNPSVLLKIPRQGVFMKVLLISEDALYSRCNSAVSIAVALKKTLLLQNKINLQIMHLLFLSTFFLQKCNF